jgi:predicted aminopeptidase
MPTLTQRLKAFLASPQGQRLLQQGQQQLAKPENQERLRRAYAKMQQRRNR